MRNPVPLKVRELLRMLEDEGRYVVARVAGQRQYKHPTKVGRVTVPGDSAGLDAPSARRQSPQMRRDW